MAADRQTDILITILGTPPGYKEISGMVLPFFVHNQTPDIKTIDIV